MIRKPNGSDAKRLGTGVLVAGVVAAGAVALAGPASAAATSITATPAQANYHVGSTATINVTTTGTPTSLMYRITAGPDKTAGTTGLPCAPTNTSPSVCTFTNANGAGTDTVQVFDDTDNSGTFNTGETQTTTTVVFSGNPTALTLTPANGGNVAVDNPATFTVHATDVNGNAAAGSTVAISSVETNTAATSTLTYSDSTGTGRGATVNAPGTAMGSFTHTSTENVTTDASGNATVKVASDMAGSVAVTASFGAVTSSTSTFTVTGGKMTNNDVTKITATPTTQTAGTNGTASVVVKATDVNGDPVGGVTVSYEITSGPDATGAGNFPTCTGTTAQATGNVTCTIPAANNTTAGTDAIEFFVNQTVAGTTQTAGPDASEPNATASIAFVAQPAYDSITLTTPDQSTAGNNTNATVITGTASSTFTATVEEENAAGTAEVPVSGAVVNFTATATAPNGATVALNPTSATTNASGVATTVATPSTTTAGTTYTVTATVGNGSSFNGGGSNSASATVTYAASAAQAPVLTPKTQSAKIGGSATVTATVDDQFGTPKANVSVAFTVAGRNAGQAQNITTGTNGTAVFTYTDAPTNANSTTDTVTATTAAGSDTATVNWLATVTVSKIVLSYNCSTTVPTGTAATDTATVDNTSYADFPCAIVENSAGDALSGVAVTFTASQPFINKDDNTTPQAAAAAGQTTVTDTTDDNGTVDIAAGSTKTGNQVITATAGGVTSNSLTTTYNADTNDAITFTLTPATATVAAGGSQKFTATVLDKFGNGVANDEILFSQSGPGTVNNTFGFTGPDGTASVLLSVPAGSTGTGTVTATDGFFGNGNDTATASYTVGTTNHVNVQISGGAKNGSAATATATVTDASGDPVNGATVNFAVTGAESVTGSAMTNGNGVATFNFTATHSGSFTVTATVGTDSGTAPGTTAKTTVTASVALSSTVKHQVMETATLSLKRGGVTVRFYSVTGGVKTFVASSTTNANGVARHTVTKLTSGHNYRVVARAVNLPNDYTGTYSPKATISVS